MQRNKVYIVILGCSLILPLVLVFGETKLFLGIILFLVIILYSVFKRSALVILFSWFLLSPIIDQLASIDFGAGIPAITFSRVILFLLFVILLFSFFLSKKAKTLKDRVDLNGIWLILFLLFVAVSLFKAEERVPSIQVFLDSFLLPAFFYFFGKKMKYKHQRLLINIIIIVGLYAFILAIAQYVTEASILGGNILVQNSVVKRVPGPFRTPEVFGSLSAVFSLFAVLKIHESQNTRKYLFYIVVLFFTLNVFLSFFRTAWVAYIIGLSVLAWLNKKNLKVFLILISILIFIIFLLPSFFDISPIKERALNKLTAQERLFYLIAAVKLISWNPLLGIGFGNYRHFLPQVFYEVNYIPESMQAPGFLVAHNSFAQIAVEGGILSILPLLLFIFTILKYGWILVRRPLQPLEEHKFTYYSVLFTAYIVSLLPHLAQSMFYYAPYANAVSFIIAGWIVREYKLQIFKHHNVNSGDL